MFVFQKTYAEKLGNTDSIRRAWRKMLPTENYFLKKMPNIIINMYVIPCFPMT